METTGKDAILGLLELIKCPICLEIYADPRMLPCQHSFCLCCLERLAESDSRWGRCPQCRQLFRIPFNGVGSFDVNRTIAQLIETFPKQQIGQRPALRAKCASCRKEETITTCEHCKEALCKPCRMEHFSEVKAELGKNLTKIVADSDKLLVKEVESISRHEINVLKCKEIRSMIQKKVTEVVQRVKDEEAKLLDDVEDFERAESSFLADKTVRLKELEAMSQFSSYSNKVLINKEETDQEVMEMTENCLKYSSNLIEFTRNLNTRYMTRRISFFDRDTPEAAYSLGYVETVTNQECGSLFSDDNDDNDHNSHSASTSTHVTSNPAPSEDKYETLEMQLKPTQPPKQRRYSYSRRLKVSNQSSSVHYVPIKLVNSKNPSPKSKSVLEPRKFFQPYKIIGCEGEENSEFRHPLGVAVSPINGHIYVADSWNNRLQTFDENGSFLKAIDKIGHIEFHYPYSIHLDAKGRIYVSDQSIMRIKVFDSGFNLLRVIGRYGREVGCYSGLCDMSTDADNNVYVCDSGNHRILKFSETGEFLSQWGSNGSSEGLFKCPACVTVHEDKVLVSDWGNHRVQVFTLEGKFLHQIGKQGMGPGEFKRPLGVAIDDKGNLVIVDEGNNRLQIFRSDFSYHSKISGLKADFQRPWDVAITKQGGIVVSEYYGHRLQVL